MLNLTDLARELGVSRPTVYKWLRDGCPHEVVDGARQFHAPTVRAWREQHRRPAPIAAEPEPAATEATEAPAPSSPSPETRADVELRKQRALAESQELTLAQRRGELVSRAEITHAVAEGLYTLRRRASGVPELIAGRLSHLGPKARAEIRAAARAEIEAALESVADGPFGELPICAACRQGRAA